MKKHGRDRRPYVKPVTKIELSESNVKLRWILIVVLLSIAVVSIGMGLFSLLNTQPGWNAVEASSDKPNCSMEFTLMYDFSETGGGATAVNKSLTQLYSQATEDAYALFSPDVQIADLGNVWSINQHVNETVTVEPALYEAISLLEEYGNRCIYLAPIYVEYDRIFHSESDPEAAQFDPEKNPEVLAWVQELAAYASDPEMIRLELLGENQVKLIVADAYLSFARENSIGEFVDFGWMKNAFIADYIAERLTEQGYTEGYLASFDGFTRNLDTRGGEFLVNIFDRELDGVYIPARMTYSGPMSIVFLRDYPMDELDRWHYYTYENGEIVTAMIDPSDGRSKASITDLVCYSQTNSCARLLMEMLPVYMAEEFSPEAVNELRENDISGIWCQDGVVYHNDAAASLELLPDGNGNVYMKTFAE